MNVAVFFVLIYKIACDSARSIGFMQSYIRSDLINRTGKRVGIMPQNNNTNHSLIIPTINNIMQKL